MLWRAFSLKQWVTGRGHERCGEEDVYSGFERNYIYRFLYLRLTYTNITILCILYCTFFVFYYYNEWLEEQSFMFPNLIHRVYKEMHILITV